MRNNNQPEIGDSWRGCNAGREAAEAGLSILKEFLNRRIRECAGEAGSHVGESPTGRIRRFTTGRDVRKEAARLNLQAGHLLNQQAITKVNSI